jgi:hypothetical protein
MFTGFLDDQIRIAMKAGSYDEETVELLREILD